MYVRTVLRHTLHAALLLILGAGCSSSGTAVPPPSQQTNTAAPTATVTFTITPDSGASGSSASRKPSYLSTLTQSVSIVPIESGQPGPAPTIVNLAAGATGCVGSGSALTCTGTVKAPIGETSFTISTFAQQNGQGGLLSVGTITLAVAASGTTTTISNATSLTLSGVPASFSLSITPTSITIGTPATVTANVTTYDAAGAIIIAPGSYATAVDIETITPLTAGSLLLASNAGLAPPGCTYQATATTACHVVGFTNAPALPVSLAYAGVDVSASSITLVAEAAGLASQTATLTLATPSANSCVGAPIVVCPALVQFASPSSGAIPLNVTETGVSTFQVDATQCAIQGIATVNFSTVSNGSAFSIEPETTPGSCTLQISDAAKNVTTVNVTLLASATPSPSATPSATPAPSTTPVPIGPIAIAPANSLEFTSSTAAPQTFTASESGVSSFTVDQSNCSGIATISSSAGTSFTVTPVAALTQGGLCTLAVHDASARTSYVGIAVDGVSFQVQ